MTAHREGSVAQDAVNRAAAHRFVDKPSELAEMPPALRRALQGKRRRDGGSGRSTACGRWSRS